MIEADKKRNLERFLANSARARSVAIQSLVQLQGGAIQENYFCEAVYSDGPLAGSQRLVVRMSAPADVAVSHSRSREFAVLSAAFRAGVRVPEPISLCTDPAVLGRDFFVMQSVEGVALGAKVVKGPLPGVDRDTLAHDLGRELARIHSIEPGIPGLDFLEILDDRPAIHLIKRYRLYLDEMQQSHPVLEWGLRWLELNAPDCEETVLVHRDFRTGNYLVDETGLSAILDWEFAGWGDPYEDIGWFCSRSWRFSAPQREAGGIADRIPFYTGYQAQSGRSIDTGIVRYWEVMANVRWAIIALQQNARYTSGSNQTLELALIGRRSAEMELEILTLTERQD